MAMFFNSVITSGGRGYKQTDLLALLQASLGSCSSSCSDS